MELIVFNAKTTAAWKFLRSVNLDNDTCTELWTAKWQTWLKESSFIFFLKLPCNKWSRLFRATSMLRTLQIDHTYVRLIAFITRTLTYDVSYPIFVNHSIIQLKKYNLKNVSIRDFDTQLKSELNNKLVKIATRCKVSTVFIYVLTFLILP